MPALDLSAFKPEADDDGDASQISGAFTTIENWANGGIPPAALAPGGAASGQALIWNGSAWVPTNIAGPPIYRASTPVVVQNTVTETTLIDQAIAAGALGTNKMARCRILATADQNTGAGTTGVLRVYWGGTLISGHTAVAFASNTIGIQKPQVITFTIANLGATNSQVMNGAALWGTGNTAIVGAGRASSVNTIAFGADGLAVDTTQNQNIKVTWQWGTATATQIFRAYYTAIEVI